MRKIIPAICLALLLAGQAFAQFSGQLSTPEVLKSGESRAGFYVGLFDDAISILGQYRYGIGGYTDLGFKLGIVDLDQGRSSNTGVDLNFDVKYQAMDMNLRDPINLSAGGVVDFLVVEDFNVISLGGYALGSYPISLKSGRNLEPYGRLIFRIERADSDYGNSDTDFEIGFNMGAAFDLSKQTRAFGELQFDQNFGFLMGLDFGL